MNKAVAKVATLICAVALTIGMMSCESKYSKETNDLIQKYKIALTQEDLQECKRYSNLLGNRDLKSGQAETFKDLNCRLVELEKKKANEEAQRNYEKATRKANEAQTWLDNSIKEYEQLLKKQDEAETLNEYIEIEKQKVLMERQRDEKLREMEQYINEARIYQSKMNN